MKQTRSSNPQETLQFHLEVKRSSDNQRLHSKSILAPSETQAKIMASLEILRMMYSGQDPKWLDLVDQMANTIAKNRIERGAGEKPVLKPYIPLQKDNNCIMID